MREEEMVIGIVALVFGLPALVLILGFVVQGMVKAFCHHRDISLKMAMIARGHSAEEIDLVLRAGRPGSWFRNEARRKRSCADPSREIPTKPPRNDAAFPV